MCGQIIWILGVDLISWPIYMMFSFSVILLLQFIPSAPGHFRSNPFPFKLYQRMNLVLESGMAWSRQNPHTDQNNFESVLARRLLGESAVGVGVFLGRTKRRPRDLMQATDRNDDLPWYRHFPSLSLFSLSEGAPYPSLVYQRDLRAHTSSG